ncbi:hypothetical protein ABW19_dt0205213 [Dactylella cylindrospora]|nr:hypothetical protein ABW19_dt0205213 [Dactylella cylindrospora]
MATALMAMVNSMFLATFCISLQELHWWKLREHDIPKPKTIQPFTLWSACKVCEEYARVGGEWGWGVHELEVLERVRGGFEVEVVRLVCCVSSDGCGFSGDGAGGNWLDLDVQSSKAYPKLDRRY